MRNTQIKVENLRHVYSERTPFETVAIHDLSFEVEKGEFIGIIGHTGSGKSTMIQHLNGLLKPSAGSIWIDDTEITGKDVKMRDIRTKVGLVFQYPEYQLFEETVHKDVAFGPTNLGLPREEVDERVREAIALVDLDYDKIGNRSPFALSGGQKRRVAIAGVIAMRPQVLILDEPTAGLDPKAHRDILAMIEKIHREEGTTILLVSHNMGDIARLADRVFVIAEGTMAMSGTPQEVFKRADELSELGLGLPPVTEILYRLQDAGASVSADALTLQEGVDTILNWLEVSHK